MRSEQLSFKKNVAMLTKETQSLSCHFDGVIKQVTITCPYGPSYLVEIQVKRNQDPIFPTNGGYFTIDDATISFPLSESIKKGEMIVTEWINHDADFEHMIPVVVSIVQEFE